MGVDGGGWGRMDGGGKDTVDSGGWPADVAISPSESGKSTPTPPTREPVIVLACEPVNAHSQGCSLAPPRRRQLAEN